MDLQFNKKHTFKKDCKAKLLWKCLHKKSATWLFCPSNDLKIKRNTHSFMSKSQNSCKKLFNFVQIFWTSCCFCATSSNDFGSKLKFLTFHCSFPKKWKVEKNNDSFFLFFVQTKNTPTIFIKTIEICDVFRFFPSDDPLDQSFQLFCFYLYTYNLSKFTEIEQKSSKNRKKLTFCSKRDQNPLKYKIQKSENFGFRPEFGWNSGWAGC